ncbi:hypothetical protein [Legionella maceachernii]|nr:hypothetical protein [Legionella maceachernii]
MFERTVVVPNVVRDLLGKAPVKSVEVPRFARDDGCRRSVRLSSRT